MELLRRYYDDRTEGKWIFPDDSYCFNLERPWLNNKVNESCIPEGTYIVCEDSTGKHQWFKFKDVPNRTFIEMHPASKVSELLGCLAPCMELRNGYAYRNKEALMKFKEWFPNKGECFVVTIRKWHPRRDGKWREE
ncbi:hypothetical protein HWD03_gp035 [Alteromonas phage vB_AmeM_PT11-V22]|uniref:DUF5675 domain-containing protein n=1 Tax=Alteromonas phage vB_AmeM_PT11-V22 TaxID=2704031 RepID=A0A6C0R0S0_9CAUD|nr:hypothetical protein HWD03_gp035 [Alteromonas phage vB_AmeM_PT11-V22]QHZ59758.1 hypothetical protein [Alteromonas phage vB_AmeM_PT11-V22]